MSRCCTSCHPSSNWRRGPLSRHLSSGSRLETIYYEPRCPIEVICGGPGSSDETRLDGLRALLNGLRRGRPGGFYRWSATVWEAISEIGARRPPHVPRPPDTAAPATRQRWREIQCRYLNDRHTSRLVFSTALLDTLLS